MMRDIKFRAWDDGEYTYSDDYIGDGHEKVAILLSEFFGLDVEQYTGLKDKNGKEIYEGDILCCENMVDRGDGYCDPYVGTVSFEQSQAYYIIASDEPLDGGYGFVDIDECEIIGNIHEH